MSLFPPQPIGMQNPGMTLPAQMKPYQTDVETRPMGLLDLIAQVTGTPGDINLTGDPKTYSAQIQEALGAKEPNQGGLAKDILSQRFQTQNSIPQGFQQEPSWDDVAQGAAQTFFGGGKPVSGQSVSDERMKNTLEQLATLSKAQYMSKGGGSGSVFAQTMEAINADPDLANLSMMDKIRLAQNKLGTNLTIGANGQVSDMAGAAQGLGNLKYGENTGGETATQQVRREYLPGTERLVQDQKNQSDLQFSGPIKTSEGLATGTTKQITDLRQAALDAQDSLYLNKQARDLLSKGIISGAGANGLAKFGAALQQAGINFSGDPVSNTQAFIASRAQAVGQKIRMFGSGTGLSDNDRIYAETMAAGRINLNEAAIKKILDMDDLSSQRTIGKFNSQISKVPQTLTPFDLSLPNDTQSAGGVVHFNDLPD